jgi:hypothetical protein
MNFKDFQQFKRDFKPLQTANHFLAKTSKLPESTAIRELESESMSPPKITFKQEEQPYKQAKKSDKKPTHARQTSETFVSNELAFGSTSHGDDMRIR